MDSRTNLLQSSARPPASMQIRAARCLLAAQILYRNFTRGLPMRVMVLQTLLTFAVVLPVLCLSLPHSAYYYPGDRRMAHFHLRNEDERRVAQGNAYIGALKSKRWEYVPDEGAQGPRLAIGVLAVDRNNRKIDAYQPHYLTQTLHSLLASADRDRRLYGGRFASLDIVVCNVDPQAAKFAEAKRWGQALQVLARPQPSVLPVPRGGPAAAADRRCQPKAEWSWCLGALAQAHPSAEWLAVLEDDQLARLDAVSALHDVLETKLTRRFGRDARQQRVGMVQLHYQSALLRYAWLDTGSWLEMMLTAGCIGLASFVLYYRLFCNPILLMPNLALMGYLLVYSVAFVLAVGRPNWLAMRHALTRHYGLDEPLTDAFSAALLPRQSADWLAAAGFGPANETAPGGCWTPELAVAALRNSGRRVLTVYPNLLRHVGLYSAQAGGLVPGHLLD